LQGDNLQSQQRKEIELNIKNQSKSALQLDLNIKCFNQQINEFKMDLQELENELESKHRSSMLNSFQDIDTDMTLQELYCRIQCP